MTYDWTPLDDVDDEWFVVHETDMATMIRELGARAFSWLQDVNAFEHNHPEDILNFIPES